LAKCRDWQGRASAAEISQFGELVGTSHIRGPAVSVLLQAEWSGRVGIAKHQAREEREGEIMLGLGCCKKVSGLHPKGLRNSTDQIQQHLSFGSPSPRNIVTIS